MVYEIMCREYKRIGQKIQKIQKELAKCPPGKILISKNGNYNKWRYNNGNTVTHLPKEKRKFAEKLMAKRYLQLQLKNLQHEQMAMEFYFRHHDTNAIQSEISFFNSPGHQELLAPHFKLQDQKLDEWKNAQYQKNELYPEGLICKALSGIYVRSKSETYIDMYLYKNKIPFRYECALQLDKATYYPDFTICHPVTGEIFYWEHLGKIDQPKYRKDAFQKIQTYIAHGIIPSVNLILTYETANYPLSPSIVENIVKHYFL